MSMVTKALATGCLPLLAAGVAALAQPAAASTDNLECDNTSSHYIWCALDNNGLQLQFTNEVWTVNGAHITSADGHRVYYFSCGGGYYTVGVSYRDETGTPRTESEYLICRTGPPA
jgi:hypothetical protein